MQRHLTTEHVPTAKDRTFRERIRLMRFSVRAHILTIHIRVNPRIDHRMIQGGIEDHLLLIRSTADIHLSQSRIPQRAGTRTYRVKIPILDLRFQVLFRTLQAYKGNTGLEKNLLIRFGLKLRKEPEVLTLICLWSLRNLCVRCQCLESRALHEFPMPILPSRDIHAPYTIIFQRFGELRIKIHGIPGRTLTIPPASAFRRTFHSSGDRMVFYHLNRLIRRSTSYTTG